MSSSCATWWTYDYYILRAHKTKVVHWIMLWMHTIGPRMLPYVPTDRLFLQRWNVFKVPLDTYNNMCQYECQHTTNTNLLLKKTFVGKHLSMWSPMCIFFLEIFVKSQLTIRFSILSRFSTFNLWEQVNILLHLTQFGHIISW